MTGGRISVSKSEYDLLKRIIESGIREDYLDAAARKLGISKSTLASLLMLLADKGLVEVEEETREYNYLTDKGRDALRNGLPERRLVETVLRTGGEADIGEIRRVLGGESGIAIGQARKKGYITIESGRVRLVRDPRVVLEELGKLEEVLKAVDRGEDVSVPKELVERGLVRSKREIKRKFKLVHDPKTILDKVVVEYAKLTSSLVSTGEWRRIRLRRYDITAEPPRIYPARKHFLVEFIEMLRDIMKELGFIEVRGPLVEIELFNFDVLFQAQDHPAREIHDTLWIKEPRKADLSAYSDLVERVARIHERGWGYKWNPDIAARLLLRSQTTSVSARILVERPKPPIRFFTLGRVYRSDVVDATHLPEFHQLDGIMGWKGYTFRDLIGLLQEVAKRLGLNLKLKPGYFPFTEPSVEGYVQLPNGRWLELFGAGLFRPEVLEAAGVDYPVGAWGFGVERLAAAVLGISDIRELYTKDVKKIMEFKVRSV
ncbi:MAG: phenylalanine--tRNA ligase subunit alpha [Desulfurococcales archaeon]|nr:phenylalanine--tRNA ligase subunit alpha [Desulfurococcales archaeon]